MTPPEGLPTKTTCSQHGPEAHPYCFVCFRDGPTPIPLPEEDAKTEGIDLRRMTDEWICDGNVSPQAVIDLRDALTAARAEVEGLTEKLAWMEMHTDDHMAELASLREENRRLREALKHVKAYADHKQSGSIYDDKDKAEIVEVCQEAPTEPTDKEA